MGRFLYIFFILPIVVYGQNRDTTSTISTSSNKGSFVVFPVVGFAPETSVQLGAVSVWVLKRKDGFQSAFQRVSTITPYIIYTLRKQSIAAISLDYYLPKGHNLNLSTLYRNFPDFYFGIGNGNDPDNSEKYTNQFFQLIGQFLYLLNEKVFAGVAFNSNFTNILDLEPGGLLETESILGINGGNLFGVGPAFRYDTRDYTVYPTKGYLITSKMVFNLAGDFKYTSYEADFRKYTSIKNEKNILAFQFRTQFTIGTDVPFYKLPQLGGYRGLRGVENASLYRDRQMIYTQVEYRRPLFWRFGFTIFAGVGDVANDLDGFNLSEFKYVVGIGGRFAVIPKRKINARLDIGLGRGGQRGIYIGINEAF